MKRNFDADRPFLENEFQQAAWDDTTGLRPDALKQGMWEIVKANPELPMILLRGKVFSFLAENARLALNPHSIFSGKMDLGVQFGEFATQGVYSDLYSKANAEVLKRADPELCAQKELAERMGVGFGVADFWHTMPDWAEILRLGFPGMLQRLRLAEEEKRRAGTLTQEQEWFYRSAAEHVQACISYTGRLRALAAKNDLWEWEACLAAIAQGAPQTLYQAMQTSLIYLELEEMGVERGRTLGRLDVLYAPYYRKALAEGASREEIKDLFRYFFLRFHAARRFASQPIAIGGHTEDGADGDEELILLMLEVYRELNIRNPKIQVRVHPGLSEKILRFCMELIRQGKSSVVFLNDETVINAYGRIGIPREEAAKYVPFGCYEPMLPGMEDAMIGASWCNMAKAAEFAMNGGRDPGTGETLTCATPETFENFEDFYSAIKTHVRQILRFIRRAIAGELPHTMEINPSPLYSASIASCVERGKDVFGGGMRYHNVSIKCFGVATLTDAVLAVKRFVFEKQEIGFEQFRQVLAQNWQGHEMLRQKILNDPCKYGNNCPEADEIACDLYRCIAEEVVGKDTGFGGKYRLGGDSITNCIGFAQKMGATPDGRRAGEPVSKNFCPSAGMEKNGVTAYLESVGKLDYADFADAAVVDFTLHRSAVEGEAGLEAMLALLRYAFRKGVFALQGNVLDAAELLDARTHPEKYQDLQVRLCGWNEYWIHMEPVKQDAFLKRLQAN